MGGGGGVVGLGEESLALVVVAEGEEALAFEAEVGGHVGEPGADILHEALAVYFQADAAFGSGFGKVMLIGAEEARKDGARCR